MICCVQVSSFALSSLSLKGWECECECECPPRRCWSFRCLPGCPRSDVTPVHPLFRNAYNNGRSRSGYNRKGIRPWNAVSLLSPINRNYSIKKKNEVHPVPLKIYIPKNGMFELNKRFSGIPVLLLLLRYTFPVGLKRSAYISVWCNLQLPKRREWMGPSSGSPCQ